MKEMPSSIRGNHGRIGGVQLVAAAECAVKESVGWLCRRDSSRGKVGVAIKIVGLVDQDIVRKSHLIRLVNVENVRAPIPSPHS